MVPSVPITPILLFMEFFTAQIAPASITPIIGTFIIFFNTSKLNAEAVLHATTISLTSLDSKNLEILVAKFVTTFFDFEP